jgi:hypothetical protein
MKAKLKKNKGMGSVGFSDKMKLDKPKDTNIVATPGTRIDLRGKS